MRPFKIKNTNLSDYCNALAMRQEVNALPANLSRDATIGDLRELSEAILEEFNEIRRILANATIQR